MKIIAFMVFSTLLISQALNAQITWDASPTQISSNGVNSIEPQIGVDQNGNSVAIWLQNGLLTASNLPQGGSWSSQTTLSASSASSPQLVVDNNGNATAIWVENGLIMASSQPFGGSWSAETAISNSGASSPTLGVDSSGNVAAAWVNNGYIISSILPFGGTWSTAATLSARIADSPQIALGNGTAVAVWHSVISSFDTILAAETSISTISWSTPVAISNADQNSLNPALAVDIDGNATAIWYTYEMSDSSYTDVYVQASYQPYGESFETPITISYQAGMYNPNLLISNVGFDSMGNCAASWNTSFDGATFSYEVNLLPKYGSWIAQPLDFTDQNLYAYQSNLGVDPSGASQFICMANTYDNLVEIQVSEIDIYAYYPGYTYNNTLSTSSPSGFPRISTNSNASGAIYATGIWITYNGTNTVINASSGTGTIYPSPTNLSVTQGSNNFDIFTQYYNTLSWTASTNPDTANYIIYRNGIYINNVPSDQTSYVDPNQIQNGSVTYGIAAVDNNYNQSPIVTVSYP